VAAVVAGLWVALPPLAVDAYPTTYLRSTVPYQASSIVNGVELYGAHCAACHGRSGAGDGPGGAGLPRRPADLTAPHTGQHTAGDLFWWLTHGIPAGGMPPFGGALSAEDRWDAINFLRALSAGQEARILSPLVEPGRAWLAAPDFTFAVGPSPARSLKELRGQRTVLLVLFSLPASAPRMRQLAEIYGELQFLGTEIIAVPMNADPGILARLGGDPPVLYPVVTDGAADIARAYALFGRTLAPAGVRPEPPVPAHMELLIDRQGYIRARWIPGEGRSSWSDLTILRDEIQILAGEVAGPPPDEHVH
jgi:putative copper resistance protein D